MEFLKLIDASLIIAIITGTIYSVNFAYLSAYYSIFGLTPEDMNLSVPRILSANLLFLTCLVIIAAVFLKSVYMNETREQTFLSLPHLIIAMGGLGLLNFASFIIGKMIGEWHFNFENRHVELETNQSIDTTYRLLCLTDTRLFLFKNIEGKCLTLSLKLDTIEAFKIRNTPSVLSAMFRRKFKKIKGREVSINDGDTILPDKME